MTIKRDLVNANTLTKLTEQPDCSASESTKVEIHKPHPASSSEDMKEELLSLGDQCQVPRRFGTSRTEHRRLDDEFNSEVRAFMSHGRFVARTHMKSLSKRVQVLRKMRIAVH